MKRILISCCFISLSLLASCKAEKTKIPSGRDEFIGTAYEELMDDTSGRRIELGNVPGFGPKSSPNMLSFSTSFHS